MAGIQWQTSFDHYTTITQRFQTTVVSANGGSLTIGAYGRNGTNGLRSHSEAGGAFSTVTAAVTLPTALSTVYIAAGIKVSALPTLVGVSVLQIRDVGVAQCELNLLPDGTFNVTRNGTVVATSTGIAVLLNTYYHVEWKVVIGNSGSTELRINEVERINQSSIDTQNTANSTISQVVLGLQNGSGAAVPIISIDYDDIIVRDDAWNGDLEVKVLLADGAGNYSEWTASAGSNFQNVDDTAPDDDSTENHTSVVNNRDTFTFGNVSTTAEVRALVTLLFAKKTDAGTAKIVDLFRISSTDYASATEHAPSLDSYAYHPTIHMLSPASGVTWTATEVNAMEAGYKRTA